MEARVQEGPQGLYPKPRPFPESTSLSSAVDQAMPAWFCVVSRAHNKLTEDNPWGPNPRRPLTTCTLGSSPSAMPFLPFGPLLF